MRDKNFEMTKTPAIVNKEEKQNIICFLLSATYPTTTRSYKQKKGIRRKSKTFTCKNGVLFVKEGDVLKRYICEHKTAVAGSIIRSKHLSGNVDMNNLSKTIARDCSEIA
ncbi:hypothetical protein CDIK_4027 [Cucumispora dikerogammari]|nr:hypothetical protein CDIK_4027 [Cucumispora dikerogammari]